MPTNDYLVKRNDEKSVVFQKKNDISAVYEYDVATETVSEWNLFDGGKIPCQNKEIENEIKALGKEYSKAGR